jgi:3D (Asp-Asp-Asp) domain-containing protein
LNDFFSICRLTAMSEKQTVDTMSTVRKQRMLQFSDLLPIPMARFWRMVRATLMLSVAGLFVGMTTVKAAHALDRPQATVELMHDIIQTPQVTALPHTKIIWMEVTAYCPCTKCCGPHASGTTASGKSVDYNTGRFVAADTALLPFGSKVIVPGYTQGPVEVIDRGSAIKGNRLDVFFPTHEQAMSWGRQWIPVTVLD